MLDTAGGATSGLFDTRLCDLLDSCMRPGGYTCRWQTHLLFAAGAVAEVRERHHPSEQQQHQQHYEGDPSSYDRRGAEQQYESHERWTPSYEQALPPHMQQQQQHQGVQPRESPHAVGGGGGRHEHYPRPRHLQQGMRREDHSAMSVRDLTGFRSHCSCCAVPACNPLHSVACVWHVTGSEHLDGLLCYALPHRLAGR